MRKFSTLLLSVFFVSQISAQSLRISKKIIATDTITEDGVTFAASSDDAEQENDEIDALYDDDIDAGWEGAAEDQNILTCGLRFQNLGIPAGATIDSAFLIISSHEAKSKDDVAKLTITCNDVDDAQTFDESNLITDRVMTSSKVNWTVDVEWGLWTTHRTPNLKTIVQEVVDRSGWKSGNSIAFIMAGENQGPSDDENAREFESFENIADPEDGGDGKNHPERIPELVVYFTVSNAMAESKIIATDTITEDGVTFAASSDDAEQENDEIDALFDDDIDAGWEGAAEDQNILTCGLRFQNVHVPNGATVDSAFIYVYSHEAKLATDVAKLTITCNDVDNALTFDETNLISDRTMTSEKINWTVDVEWGLWTEHRTPNLAAVVQEVVDRSGWESGNALAFIMAGENQGPSDDENAREFESFENIADPEDGGDGKNHPERIPRLVVYYSSNSGNSSVSSVSEDHVTVYPNPAQTELYVKVSEEDATVRLLNHLGSEVKTVKSYGKNIVSIDLKSITSGIYFVEVNQGYSKTTKKVIVNK